MAPTRPLIAEQDREAKEGIGAGVDHQPGHDDASAQRPIRERNHPTDRHGKNCPDHRVAQESEKDRRHCRHADFHRSPGPAPDQRHEDERAGIPQAGGVRAA
jgi:hypothetical protein